MLSQQQGSGANDLLGVDRLRDARPQLVAVGLFAEGDQVRDRAVFEMEQRDHRTPEVIRDRPGGRLERKDLVVREDAGLDRGQADLEAVELLADIHHLRGVQLVLRQHQDRKFLDLDPGVREGVPVGVSHRDPVQPVGVQDVGVDHLRPIPREALDRVLVVEALAEGKHLVLRVLAGCSGGEDQIHTARELLEAVLEVVTGQFRSDGVDRVGLHRLGRNRDDVDQVLVAGQGIGRLPVPDEGAHHGRTRRIVVVVVRGLLAKLQHLLRRQSAGFNEGDGICIVHFVSPSKRATIIDLPAKSRLARDL